MAVTSNGHVLKHVLRKSCLVHDPLNLFCAAEHVWGVLEQHRVACAEGRGSLPEDLCVGNGVSNDMLIVLSAFLVVSPPSCCVVLMS